MTDAENPKLQQHEKTEEEKELLRIEEGDQKGKCKESVTLEEALDIAGFGKYNYMVVFTAGINILGCISPIIIMSYVIPATDCDLNLSTFEKGFLSSMMFTGMVCTTHLFGVLADEYGRRSVSMKCNAASSILTLITAFCPNFASMSAIAFLNGAASAGVITPAYIFVGESTPHRYRASSILAAGAFGNMSNAMLPAVAIILIPISLGWNLFGYLTINSWRVLIALTSLIPMTGVILFSLISESPKFLLMKGFSEQTRDVLQRMYSINTGRRREDFPVKTVRLDSMDQGIIKQKTSMKSVIMQTVGLFREPLKKSTIIACNVQAGTFAAANIIYMWLPQIVNQMMKHSQVNQEYGVTFCHVLQSKGESITIEPLNTINLISNGTSDLSFTNGTTELMSNLTSVSPECVVNVPVDTYYIATLMGIVQLVTFPVMGWLSHQIGEKKLLVIGICLSGTLIIASTMTTEVWSTVVCMIGSGVTMGAGIPIAASIIMGLFPTNVRSTASCLTFFTGRLVSSIGMQIMGALQSEYCNFSYWGLGVWVMGVGVLVLFGLPSPKR